MWGLSPHGGMEGRWLTSRPALSKASTAALIERLESAGAPCAPVAGPGDGVFFSDPQAIGTGRIGERSHPVLGTMKVSDNLVGFENTGRPNGRATPLLGQHTREVLSEVGYSDSEVDDLLRNGVAVAVEPQAS